MPKAKHIDEFEASYKSTVIDRLMAQITPAEQEVTDFKMMLAAKIYEAMKRKGWTQTQFAERANQHVSVISKWLSGTHNFTVETLVFIQRLLEIRLLDAEENNYKSMLDVKLTITAPSFISEEELHEMIYQSGGFQANYLKENFESTRR